MEYAIEATNLVKDFSNHKALQGVDFKVPRGSIYGFLGPNGAGKTTAIKIILGLISPTEGKVTVLGEEVRFGEKVTYLRRVGYLPQDPVFPEGLNGKEVMEMVAGIYKMKSRISSEKISSLLSEFLLSDAAKRKVDVYSRGMKQRLGIAAVLLTEPDLLILDEPVSALDPEGRRKVLELINSLRGRSTVFFSSHILADVERVCDHVTIIDKGHKLLEIGTGELLDEYAMEQYVVTVKEGQKEKAQELLQAGNYIREVELMNENLLVTSQPGQLGKLAENILPLLINNDIIVTEFMHRRVDLEEIFFRVLQQNNSGNGGRIK